MKNEYQNAASKLLIITSISAFSYAASADDTVASSTVTETTPFASQPLQLIDRTVSKEINNTKPNIMLFIDDSTSMNKPVTGSGNRIKVVKSALLDIIDTYGERFNWNLFTLWATEENLTLNEKGNFSEGESGHRHNYMGKTEISNLIKKVDFAKSGIQKYGHTPATIRYLEAALVAQNGFKYKCQQSFIVMLSDGDANTERYGYVGSRENSFQKGYPYTTDEYSAFDPNSVYGSLPDGYIFNGTEKGQGISFFSQKLFDTDLKTGPDWDGKQFISTYTVGFSSDLTDQGKKYLEKAGAAESNKTYFYADNPSDLKKAFQDIFSDITSSSQPEGIATTSIATPSNTSSSIADMAATMTLDTGNWSSEILFHQLGPNGQPVKKDGKYVSRSADYSGRQVIVNNGSQNYILGNSPTEAQQADFGFQNSEEFNTAFVPWFIRDSNISDSQIKTRVENLAADIKNKKENGESVTELDVKEFRVRAEKADADERQMGDVLNASTLGIGTIETTVKDSVITKKYTTSKYVVTGANDGMVYIFKSTGETEKPYQLALNYVPGGMQREGSSDTLMKNLKNLAREDYGTVANPHIYGVNGGIAYATTAATADRRQRTLALGAMGQGGRGVYALNIAGCERTKATETCSEVGMDSSDWLNSVPAWESGKVSSVDGDKVNKLGYTVGSPMLYQGATKSWSKEGDKLSPHITDGVKLLGFVANGYPGSAAEMKTMHDGKPTLYIFDALGEELGTGATTSVTNSGSYAGEILKKISIENAHEPVAAKQEKARGVLSAPTVVDIDQDGIADVVYAGDYAGDMYRFDLRGGMSDWKVAKLYDGDPKQPITAAPAVYRVNDQKVVVLFGTGSDLFKEDLKDVDQQAFYGIYDDLSDDPKLVSYDSVVTRKLTTTEGGEGKPSSRTVTGGEPKNWKINLNIGIAPPQPENGKESAATNQKTRSNEKVVVQPVVLLSTVFFSTRIYDHEVKKDEATGSNKMCGVIEETEKSSGTSWLMALDAETGGMPKTVKFADGFGKNSAGYDLGALASQATVLSSSSLKADKPPLALNDNSQVQNGELINLGKEGATKKTPLKLNNKCLNSDDYFALLAKDQREDALVSVALTGKVCPGPGLLIRLNTQEIIE